MLAIELTASSLLLLFAMLLLGRRVTWSPTIAEFAALGILDPGLASTLALLGLVTISASMSVLLWATEPILIVVLAVLLLRERIALVTTIAVALIGVMLVVVYRPGAAGDTVGVALSVAAVTACGFYTVLTRRLLLDDSSLAVVWVQQITGLCFAIVLAGVAIAVVYYGLAFWLFVSGLRGVPASVAGGFLPLIPAFGLVAGHVVGDRLAERQWLGAALVILATTAAVIRHLTRPSTTSVTAGDVNDSET